MSMIEKNIKKINARIEEISKRFDDERIDVNLFIEIFERIPLFYIRSNKFVLPYNIKKEEILSTSLKFYEKLDKELYDKLIKVFFQNKENTVLAFYNIHLSKIKVDIDYELKKYGNVLTHMGKVYITVPYHAVDEKSEYGTALDILTLCHEFSHYVDLDSKIQSNFDVGTFSENRPKFYFSISRNIFTEVIAATIETLTVMFLLEETKISKKEVLNEFLIRNNSRINMILSTLFIFKMVKIYKEKGSVEVSDVQAFIKNSHFIEDEFGKVIKKLDSPYHDVKNDLRYSMDSIFSPLLIRKIVENKDEGIKDLKEYIKFMKDDDFKEAFKVYSVDFGKANYIDVIVDNYNWYKYFTINLLKKYIPNGF